MYIYNAKQANPRIRVKERGLMIGRESDIHHTYTYTHKTSVTYNKCTTLSW